MSLAAMMQKRQSGNFATATVATSATVQRGDVATVASVAVANSKTVKTDNCKHYSGWLFHFTDSDDLPVIFTPAVDHAAALACYPDAVAAEPIPERPQRKPTKAEADEITALVNAVFPDDTDDYRAEALAAALADTDGALLCYRTIANEHGIIVGSIN